MNCSSLGLVEGMGDMTQLAPASRLLPGLSSNWWPGRKALVHLTRANPWAKRLANSSLIKWLMTKLTSCPSQYWFMSLEEGCW